MLRTVLAVVVILTLTNGWSSPPEQPSTEIIPPGERILREHPRMLLRSNSTPYAVSKEQLRSLKRDSDFEAGLKILKDRDNAASQAMVWLLTGDQAAADKAIARLKGYALVPKDAFDVWSGLRELALAYDWLYHHPDFTDEIKKHVRKRAFILAEWGLREGDDHVFHNYTWMNNSGLAMWALASYGDDPRSEQLMRIVRFRFNERMFPAMQHLNGMPGDAMGYWYIYCQAPCIWTLLSVQSAYGADSMALIRTRQDNWLEKQLESSIHSTLPNLRFIPWGDIQSGPDGGATHEWAGPAEAATWASGNPHGAFFTQWLSGKRGMSRYFGETAILYFLYARHLNTKPAEPPLAMLAGGTHSGQVVMRSSWADDATIVGFRSADHYQQHFHRDAGSFVIYRNGMLAVDAGKYTRSTESLRAAIVATSSHNTLVLGREGQRPVRGQWYKDLDEFNRAREDQRDDRRLELADIEFYKDAGAWTGVAGQFAQAYAPGTVKSCVRQLLYIRPDAILIIDNLVPATGTRLPEIRWTINLPSNGLKMAERSAGSSASAQSSNEKSWIRCRSLTSSSEPLVEEAPATQLTGDAAQVAAISRVSFLYPGKSGTATLAHVIEVGDGEPGSPGAAQFRSGADASTVRFGGRTAIFSKKHPFTISVK